ERVADESGQPRDYGVEHKHPRSVGRLHQSCLTKRSMITADACNHAFFVAVCKSGYSIEEPDSRAGSYGTTATARVRVAKCAARSDSIGPGTGVGQDSRVTAWAASWPIPHSWSRSSIQSAVNAASS